MKEQMQRKWKNQTGKLQKKEMQGRLRRNLKREKERERGGTTKLETGKKNKLSWERKKS